MSRALSSTYKAAAAAGNLRPALLGFFDFEGTPVRVWTGLGELSWDGETWLGLGDFGSVSKVDETTEIRANRVQFKLNGVPSDSVSRVLSENYRNRACKLWLVLFDETNVVIADPALLFSGRMDQCTVEDDGQTSTISIAAESRLVELQRPRERRRTHEDQQSLFPDDRGDEFVAGMQDKDLLWGAASSGTSGINGGASTADAGSVALE